MSRNLPVSPAMASSDDTVGQETAGHSKTKTVASEPVPATIKEYSKEQWQARLDELHVPRRVLNRMVMNYLVSEGYQNSAIKFGQEADLESPVDLNSIKDRMRIKALIHAGKIEQAIELINDYEPDLLDSNPALHFYLLRLQCIELIRQIPAPGHAEGTKKVLDFASTHLAPRAASNKEFLQDLEWTMALLCFPKTQHVGQLKALMDLKVRHKVASDVNDDLLDIQRVGGMSKQIHNLIKLWRWGEKTLSNDLVYFPALENKDLS